MDEDATKPRRGRRPSADFTETAAFREAVDKAASEAAARAVAEIAKSGLSLPNQDESTRTLFSQMALAIAEMSNQGSGRQKPVAPEVIQQRQAAGERCIELIHKMLESLRGLTYEEAVSRDLVPKYQVVSKTYQNDQVIEPYQRPESKGAAAKPTMIHFIQVPNESMRPVNAAADGIYDAYRESIGTVRGIGKMRGPQGQVVTPDNRPYWMTPGGMIVVGDNPKLQVGGTQQPQPSFPMGNNDPNAPEIRVLGTNALPARQNFADFNRIAR